MKKKWEKVDKKELHANSNMYIVTTISTNIPGLTSPSLIPSNTSPNSPVRHFLCSVFFENHIGFYWKSYVFPKTALVGFSIFFQKFWKTLKAKGLVFFIRVLLIRFLMD